MLVRVPFEHEAEEEDRSEETALTFGPSSRGCAAVWLRCHVTTAEAGGGSRGAQSSSWGICGSSINTNYTSSSKSKNNVNENAK